MSGIVGYEVPADWKNMEIHFKDNVWRDVYKRQVLDGIQEAKELLGAMCEVDADKMIIYGNSSLNVMYDTVARAMTPVSYTHLDVYKRQEQPWPVMKCR